MVNLMFISSIYYMYILYMYILLFVNWKIYFWRMFLLLSRLNIFGKGCLLQTCLKKLYNGWAFLTRQLFGYFEVWWNFGIVIQISQYLIQDFVIGLVSQFTDCGYSSHEATVDFTNLLKKSQIMYCTIFLGIIIYIMKLLICAHCFSVLTTVFLCVQHTT